MRVFLEDGKYITDNSKECKQNSFFICTKTNDKFKEEAKKSGASLIYAKEAKKLLNINNELKIIGITGTNGKTTTGSLIYAALLNLGYKASLCGTRGAFINGKQTHKKELTTGELLTNLSYIKEAINANCEFLIMEVSSHAIVQNRIQDIEFALKIFTNLTQDHLDYHKTFEEYCKVKSSFFSDECLKLINLDDKNITFNKKNAYTYGFDSNADFYPLEFSLKNGIKAHIKAYKKSCNLTSCLQGAFNLYNILAGFGAINLLTSKKETEICKGIESFKGVSGRSELVSKSPLVLIDFAHTPDGIEKILESLSHYSLIVVFGAGGNRDKMKRPIMGSIVQKYSKISVITSDNPRDEIPQNIINDILSGMQDEKNIINEPDRKKAINLAINLAINDNDMVVILGKGDEEYQEIKGVKYPFSDKLVVEEILKKKETDI